MKCYTAMTKRATKRVKIGFGSIAQGKNKLNEAKLIFWHACGMPSDSKLK